MLHIYDQYKNPLFALDRAEDVEITSRLDFSDKVIKFKARTQDVVGLINEGYIETKDDRFVIKEVTPSSNGWTQVVGQLDLEDLEGSKWLNFESLDSTIRVTLMRAFDGIDWTVGDCNIDKERNVQLSDVSSLDILKEVLKIYRCEAKIDSKNHVVHIYEEIGEDRGVYLTPELNLRSLEVNSTTYDYYTELEVYGTKPDNEESDGYEPTDQDLTDLRIGSLTLTPEFSPGVTSYTAKTFATEDRVSASAVHESALIVVKKIYNSGRNELEYENGDNVDWDVDGNTHYGVNTIQVDVTYGGETKRYSVTVTCRQSEIALTDFKIGEKTLSPEFDPDIYWSHWDGSSSTLQQSVYAVETMNERNRVKVSANSYYSIIGPFDDRDTERNQLRLTLKYFPGDVELTYAKMQASSEYGLLLENDEYIDSNDRTYERQNPTRWAMGNNTIGALVETLDSYRIYKIIVTRLPQEQQEHGLQ